MQFTKLFTQGAVDAYDLINFRAPEAMGDGFDVPLEHPENWSLSAVEILADEAASCALSPDLKPVEENTVPSWLWQQSRAKSVGKKETSVRHIFDRAVGSAAYQGWKQGLFDNEDSARAFFDEARYMLAQRFIAIEPRKLALLGLQWAYGIHVPTSEDSTDENNSVDISNAMIDTVVSGKRDRVMMGKWNKIIGTRTKVTSLALHFSDTESEWETPNESATGLRLNLMAFRHNDGSVNIEALRQATRIAVVLMDLNEVDAGQALAIDTSQLAPLLMALALPYDGEAARATAAALYAIVTAEAYAMSARLAGLRGASPEFTANREAILRALRNHRRAAYGEQDDYEKISVTPLPLALASCPDLGLTAAARSAWDQAMALAQHHGLRHTQVTNLFNAPMLTQFMESETDGIAPMRVLTLPDTELAGRRAVHPSVVEGLVRLGYDQKKIGAMARHITGATTLEKAPVINHVALRAHGFTGSEIAKLEAYIPQARSLRHIFTPWILGVDFCRKVLKIPAAKIEDMRFNILVHLGFSEAEIDAAQTYCYGHDVMMGAPDLSSHHTAVFAIAATMQAEAPIRMAAAVQGFVSGDTGLHVQLPLGIPAEHFEKLLLDAWRRGIKAMRVTFDAGLSVEPVKGHKRVTSAFLHTAAPPLPKRQSRTGASRLGAMSHGKAKSRGVSKGH